MDVEQYISQLVDELHELGATPEQVSTAVEDLRRVGETVERRMRIVRETVIALELDPDVATAVIAGIGLSADGSDVDFVARLSGALVAHAGITEFCLPTGGGLDW